MKLIPYKADGLDSYVKEIKDIRVLSKDEEKKEFDIINGLEDDFLMSLAGDKDSFISAIREVVRTTKNAKARDLDVDGLVILSQNSDLGTEFKNLARRSADVRALQVLIYKKLTAQKANRDAPWMKTLRSSYRKVTTARNNFASKNLKLVFSIAGKYRYQSRSLKFSDMVQEGNIGLLKAVEKFDNRMDVKFSTYASWWIKQGVRRAITDRNRNIRIPVHLNDSINKIKRFKSVFLAENGVEATIEDIAKKFKMTVKNTENIVNQYIEFHEMSIDYHHVDGEDNHVTIDLMGENGTAVLAEVNSKELRRIIDIALDDMDPRLRKVIECRFLNREELTLNTIGEGMDVSRERIRQLEQTALQILKGKMRNFRHQLYE